MEATLTYDATDGVVVMTMNRPDARNALNQELRQAIREAMGVEANRTAIMSRGRQQIA